MIRKTRPFLALAALLAALGAPLTAAGDEPRLELMIDINPGEDWGIGFSTRFFVGGRKLFFSGCQPATGCEPWVTDGTAAGTLPLADIRTGADDSNPDYLGHATGGIVLFSAEDGVTGRELWRTDGTPAGTEMVAELRPGSAGPNLSSDTFEVLGALAVFRATDSVTSRLYVYDTASAVAPQVLLGDNGRPLGSLADSLGRLVVTNQPSGSYGREPHLTDGSTVTLIEDLNPGPPHGVSPDFDRHASSGDRVFFVGSDDSGEVNELFSTDGLMVTDHGVVAPGSGDADIDDLVPLSGGVTFTVDNGSPTRELWYAPAAGDATQLLVPESGNPSPRDFVAGGGRLYFRGQTFGFGAELWRTDGTAAGTQVIDLFPGSSGSNAEPFAYYAGKLYFQGRDSVASDFQLWRTDGTLAGTELAPVDLDEPFDGQQGAVAGSVLILAVDAPDSGLELWRLELPEIFADGFETGDTSSWTATTTP